MSRESRNSVHQYVPEAAEQLRKGEIERREFLRTVTLLGVSATAAYAFAGRVTGAGLVPRAFAQTPKRGGTLRMAMRVQEMSDPAIYNWGEKANISRHMIEYLTITGADNVTRPYLAESWKPSDDLKTWTFNLRRGVKFANGQEMTADDIVFNVTRWLDPATGSSILGLLDSMLTESDGKDKDGKPIKVKSMTSGAVEKVDDYTVKLHLNSPELSIPEKMYHYPAGIVQRTFVDEGANVTKVPTGTGPYGLVEYTIGEKAVLRRRDTPYWGDAPYLDEIQYIDTGGEASASLAALASDQVDSLYVLDLTTLEAAEREIPGVVVHKANTAQTGPMRMQVDREPFNDIRVRQAILLASDNEQNFRIAHRGLGSLAENHHVCDCQPDYAPLPKIKRDVAKAKALLAEAGHGDGLSITCNVGNTQGTWEQDSVVLLKQNLAEAGIDVKVNVMPSAQYWEVWDKAKFSLTSWTHRPLATMLLGLAYRTGVPWNETHYASKEFDTLLTEAESTIDINERKKVMAKVEKRIQDDAIMVQPFFRAVMSATTDKVKGFEMHPTSYHQWGKVWIA